MTFLKTSVFDVNHLNAHPTKHKLIIAAAGATVVAVAAVVTKKTSKKTTTETPVAA